MAEEKEEINSYAHFLVPKHLLVPQHNAEEILKKLGVKLEQLPHILRDDPAIEPLKAQKNDLVKIVRDSPTAGKTIYYRRVI